MLDDRLAQLARSVTRASERLEEEVGATEVPRLEGERERRVAERRHPRHAGRDLAADRERADPERVDDRARRLAAGDDDAARARRDDAPRELAERGLGRVARALRAERAPAPPRPRRAAAVV